MRMNCTIKEISEHLERESKVEQGCSISTYEKFVSTMPLTLIRDLHTYQVDVGLIVMLNDSNHDVYETESGLPLAIMTYIACNEELGVKLESAFPEYKSANSDYAFPQLKEAHTVSY